LREKPSPSRLAHDNGSIYVQANYRGTERAAIRTLDTLRLVRLRIEVCDETVGSSEVDSYDFSHDKIRRG
jgi:hypothetical protein